MSEKVMGIRAARAVIPTERYDSTASTCADMGRLLLTFYAISIAISTYCSYGVGGSRKRETVIVSITTKHRCNSSGQLCHRTIHYQPAITITWQSTITKAHFTNRTTCSHATTDSTALNNELGTAVAYRVPTCRQRHWSHIMGAHNSTVIMSIADTTDNIHRGSSEHMWRVTCSTQQA